MIALSPSFSLSLSHPPLYKPPSLSLSTLPPTLSFSIPLSPSLPFYPSLSYPPLSLSLSYHFYPSLSFLPLPFPISLSFSPLISLFTCPSFLSPLLSLPSLPLMGTIEGLHLFHKDYSSIIVCLLFIY